MANMKTGPERRIAAVVPAYNEEGTVSEILGRLLPEVDLFIVVDDGSSDGTLGRVKAWAASCGKPAHIFSMERNRGKGAVLGSAFGYVSGLLRAGELSPDDLVLTIDADGQHEPEYLPAMAETLAAGGFDLLIARRDFSAYPAYKKFGNRLLTLWASLLGGFRFRDIESGLRLFRASAITAVLPYYNGHRYSCEQEAGIISARLGLRICNDFPVKVPRYVAGAGWGDGFWVLLFGALAFLRVTLGLKRAGRPSSMVRIS